RLRSCRSSGVRQRESRDGYLSRPHGRRSALGTAGPRRRCDHRSSGLWPHPRRPGRIEHRFRCLPPSHVRGAALRCRRAASLDGPDLSTCMHCENAPCELVCPVAATVHSSDGLNDMVYNRCVGTRYCSNNCPYKVRRFNFYEFADWNTESLRLQRNPEVTVRSRGVMEKCTYCVQRIRFAEVEAGREDRSVRDGEVVTACQSACPAGAIVFGNLADRASKVAQLQEEPYRYSLLADLNTRPRTTYLAAFRNPNPELLQLEGGR